MEKDIERAVKLFHEIRKDLLKSEDKRHLKQIDQLIILLESSYFNKIVALHKSLNDLKPKTNIPLKQGNSEIYDNTHNGQLQNDTELEPSPKEEFEQRLQLLVGNRELLHIRIDKSDTEQTLGFSIKCSGSMHNYAIFVDNVSKGSLAERSGIKAYYQIVAVNNIPLDFHESNRDIVVRALKSSQSRIDLYLSRDKSGNNLSQSKVTTHARHKLDHNAAKELNTEWTEYEVIQLSSIDGSFGFGIMASLSSDVMVRTILSGGAADLDGRMRHDDHIMYINDIAVRHMSSNHVVSMLKSTGDTVCLIVARPFDENNRNDRAQIVETVHLDDRLKMIVSQLQQEQPKDKSGGHTVAYLRTYFEKPRS